MKYTKYTGNKAERELRGEESEEPRCGVQAGADLVLLQVSVQVTVIVMQQTGQLVHLDLQREKEEKVLTLTGVTFQQAQTQLAETALSQD